MSFTAIVLAAGRGQRMKSALPKVLHPLAGRPLVHYPVAAALAAGAERVVLVVGGEGRAALEAWAASQERVTTALQAAPLGTGDAARVGLTAVETHRVVILCGDTPLLGPTEIEALVAEVQRGARLAVQSALVTDPHGYGRIVRDGAGRVLAIREQRDLQSDAERAICEINAGLYAADADTLRAAIARVQPTNAQGELYLTDAVAFVAETSEVVGRVGAADALVGVNDRHQLAQAEAMMYRRIAQRLGSSGVTLRGEVLVDDGVVVEADVTLEHGVRLRGTTRIETGVFIDVGSVLTDVTVAAGAKILPYSVLTSSRVGPGAQVGPFSHLRPGSEIDEQAHIGNFVETKQTRVRRGAKANHLAYLGDGDVGEGANIGAGTIFCNYDGFVKHRTTIGPGAFIGSDSQLVAPITVGEGAYVATGTTVTRDVPPNALAIGRTKQENKEGYATRLRGRLAAAKKK